MPNALSKCAGTSSRHLLEAHGLCSWGVRKPWPMLEKHGTSACPAWGFDQSWLAQVSMIPRLQYHKK